MSTGTSLKKMNDLLQVIRTLELQNRELKTKQIALNTQIEGLQDYIEGLLADRDASHA